MKRTILSFVALCVTILMFGQGVQRNQVILEIGTSTLCVYCPGAAMGAEDLLAAGCQVGVIEYHSNMLGADPFTNTASTARVSYYGITGLPTAFFDGVLNFVGGSNTQSMYPYYLPLYNTRYAVPSPLTICLSGSNAGNVYTVNVMVKKVATITATNMKLQLVLTESNISYSWEGQSMLHHVERLMVPNENGTTVDFTSGNVQNYTLTFTKDPTWVTANCELVAFVQDNSSKECFNGVKCMLPALPSTMMTLTDFTGNPTSGCTPLNVSYTNVSTGVTSFQWAFPGGTPSSSTVPSPSVVYNSTGTYDVTLTGSNGVCKDAIIKTGYISSTATPGTPGQPTGNSSLCGNPGPQTYTTTGSIGSTNYVWDLQPVSAGTLTNNGLSCIVNWSPTFLGSAQLKVQGTGSCGTSPWSPSLTVTISQQPTVPGTPTGPILLCIDPPNTDYATTGSTPATSYVWELTPSTAGTLTPNWLTVTVNWSNTFVGTAQLHVAAVNNGCQGPWSANLSITIDGGPGIYSMTGGGAYCGQGGNGSPVGLDGSQTGVNYTLYLNGTPTSNTVAGTGSAISFGNQMTAGTYTAVANNPSTTCNSTMNGSEIITIDPQVPDIPGDPQGPTEVHSGSTPTTDYSTTGGTYATTYTWNLTPSNAGTMNGNTNTGTATWDNNFIGTAYVKVQGVNTCGGGTFSNILTITVDNTVGIQETSRQKVLNIYPNPAKDNLSIISAKKLQVDIQIFNSLGSVEISKQKVNIAGAYKLDISQLNPGVYFIRITGNEIQDIQKVIVQ
jgi:PKD repeat protein